MADTILVRILAASTGRRDEGGRMRTDWMDGTGRTWTDGETGRGRTRRTGQDVDGRDGMDGRRDGTGHGRTEQDLEGS